MENEILGGGFLAIMLQVLGLLLILCPVGLIFGGFCRSLAFHKNLTPLYKYFWLGFFFTIIALFYVGFLPLKRPPAPDVEDLRRRRIQG